MTVNQSKVYKAFDDCIGYLSPYAVCLRSGVPRNKLMTSINALKRKGMVEDAEGYFDDDLHSIGYGWRKVSDPSG